jgi:uncharacterized Zn ribbon protein
MTDTQPTHDIEPRLKKLLELIRPVPGRNPQAVARGRARFHAEMEAAFPSRKLLKPQAIFPHKTTSQPRLLIPAFAIRAAAILVIVMALLFGGAGITAMASQDALPGETLYRVKTGLEDFQVSLTFNHMQQVELHLAFAEHRINELAALIETGETAELALTTARFELEINLAAASLRDLFAKDPAQAAELAPKLTAMLTHYAEMLADIKSDAPETAQRDMEHAQLTTQIFSHLSGQTASIFEFTGVVEDISDTAWIVNGLTITIDAATEISGEITIGDVVIIHVLLNPDNTLTAHEIKLISSEENSEDGSGDELENEEQNSNSNQNNAENEELGEDSGHEQEQEMEQESEQGSMDEDADGSTYRHGDEIVLIGAVEVISDTLWVVDGLKIVVTDETKVEETFLVGDRVKIRFIPQEDGTLIAISISPATSSDEDSMYRYNQPDSSSDDEVASESDPEEKPGSGR